MCATSRPRTRLICPLTADTVAGMRADLADAVRRGADMIECRLDYLATPPGPDDLHALFHDAPVEVLATCRPAREGGRWIGDETARLGILQEAARRGATWADVEIGVGREHWPVCQTVLSHHDFHTCPADLDRLLKELEASQALVNKLAFAATKPADAFRALDILRNSRKPAIALAMGEMGVLSRILAGKFGAFGTFAALAPGAGSAPGQPTIQELKELYRWESVGAKTEVFGVIGCPIAHSKSPAIHNAAFDAVQYDGVYVPMLVPEGRESFNATLEAILSRPWLHWRGLSVTIPHKENALAFVGADRCDELACKIGAINTITIDRGGQLRGDNTDYAAAIDALCAAMDIGREDLRGRPVAVLGAGGASRALVAALAHYGADVTVYNRTLQRAVALAEEFLCAAEPLDAASRLDAQIVINCTPIGMHPKVDASPLEDIPPCVEVVFDTIYNPVDTLLLRQARASGCLTVSGLEMFVNQAVAQFEIWTGRPAPRDVMRRVVLGK